ncbi:hypothetical protein AB0I28_35125 [Phytomonospora sp. NPDC050363]|uniref:hypothetical protein n=1 Tax=Phytomonospora sp. NPDC050363 TaxID=3155642 RepID=UPI0033E0F1C6
MKEVPAIVLVALGLAVLGVEIAALVTKKSGDTISERTRALLGIRPVRWWRPVGILALAGFAAWFVVHIVFE